MVETPLLTSHIGAGEIALRLGLAAACGFVVGIERELKSKNLGLRTNMLVAIGAALFALVGVEMLEAFDKDPRQGLQFDPSRIVEGIITGIGFLGGGAIIQGRNDIHGGTTAAAVWTLGGVGLACGFGFYLLALIAAAILIFVLTVLGLFTGSGANKG